MQTAEMKIIEPPSDEVMNYKGLSAYMKMAQGTLRRKVMNGEIPFIKIGSSVRFSKKDIDAWLKGHRKYRKHNFENGDGKGELPLSHNQALPAEGEV